MPGPPNARPALRAPPTPPSAAPHPPLQSRDAEIEARQRAENAKADTERLLRSTRQKLEDLRLEHEALGEHYRRARGALGESVAGQREAERQSEVAIASLAFAEEMRMESERCEGVCVSVLVRVCLCVSVYMHICVCV